MRTSHALITVLHLLSCTDLSKKIHLSFYQTVCSWKNSGFSIRKAWIQVLSWVVNSSQRWNTTAISVPKWRGRRVGGPTYLQWTGNHLLWHPARTRRISLLFICTLFFWPWPSFLQPSCFFIVRLPLYLSREMVSIGFVLVETTPCYLTNVIIRYTNLTCELEPVTPIQGYFIWFGKWRLTCWNKTLQNIQALQVNVTSLIHFDNIKATPSQIIIKF